MVSCLFQENIPSESEGVTEKPGLEDNAWSDPKSFKNIYSNLPEKISKNMAKNLSVPIAFVCVLHLANEKVSLHITISRTYIQKII